MVKKSLIFSLLLVLIWSAFLHVRPFSLTQHQWQGNVISAEKFIFDIDSIDNIIIGSSLANRIKMDSLPNYYNLSLNGQGVFDGLNIMRQKPLAGKVFIEINAILVQENQGFREIISSPIHNALKRNFSMLRSDKQPLAIVGEAMNAIVIKSRILVTGIGKVKYSGLEKVEQANPIFEEMLNTQRENYSNVPDTSEIDKQFELLSEHVDYLESKGVQVIFFEMPVNSQLVELEKPLYLRSRIKSEYPNNEFISLPENIRLYTTTDGLHLTKSEAEKYTRYFKSEASNR